MKSSPALEGISRLTFPCPREISSLVEICNLNSEVSTLKMKETYGVPISGIIPDGRVRDSRTSISREEAVRLCEAVHDKGLEFNYLLNAPYTLDENGQTALREYIDWIVRGFKADSVTISSFDLMKFIRKKYPDVKINVSTIAGVLNFGDMNRYLTINPKKVIVHHDLNRNFGDLSRILEEGDKKGVEIEIMLTESCIRNCPQRGDHYTAIAQGESDISFHRRCNTLKIARPVEFLRANLVRPEDLKIYEEMGVRNFKITGRSKGPGWMLEVVKAYLQRSYDGNLIRLTGIDPNLNAESWIYLENQSLEGFLKGFPTNVKDNEAYCNSWIIKLWKAGKFKVEGADYDVFDNRLVCTKLPDRLKEIYGK
jgi:collagenase-like PrtC family protease